ncbi:hypothetical protein QCD60_24050 [Pokkaliibacter sp. MBI-7]|uniref:hypothetical protein n=1 Tax=Pokkaliibacter sp. MBI-7 TaxID=3040600 RepID=UPI00244D5026|nr:hypothetical protein [Pokkaliibacter sp. MBI-7]MDH2435602.1 hypothetical protein [Pokkaliibacter sp. MBI-7]
MSGDKKEKDSTWVISTIVGIIIVAIGILYIWKVQIPYIGEGCGKDCTVDHIKLREQFGVVGDFFGGVLNPLMAFATIVLLIITLRQTQESLSISQKTLEQTENQLALSKQEMELTRQEMKEATTIQKEIDNTQKQQKFESTFFILISRIEELRNKVTKQYEGIDDQGFENKFHDRLNFKEFHELEKEPIPEIYQTYLFSLGHILDFLSSSSLENCDFYRNILKDIVGKTALRHYLFFVVWKKNFDDDVIKSTIFHEIDLSLTIKEFIQEQSDRVLSKDIYKENIKHFFDKFSSHLEGAPFHREWLNVKSDL